MHANCCSHKCEKVRIDGCLPRKPQALCVQHTTTNRDTGVGTSTPIEKQWQDLKRDLCKASEFGLGSSILLVDV